jgi:signal transduction histidine kinase
MEIGNIPDIWLAGSELRQLVLNLVRNGFDAMKPGKTLTIKSYVELDKVVLAVHDTGEGIPLAMLDKLGTPFATTKDSGTGLGLAVCYRVAERHGAKIEVETSSEGTTFYVKFELNRNLA